MSQNCQTKCCPHGAHKKHLAEEKPKGVVQQYEDLSIYCANKNKSENVIIVMYDIFGFDSGRNKIVCDWYEN